VLSSSSAVIAPNLQAYAEAYLSHEGQPNYNPALDFNHNGFIGQGDAKPLLAALAPVTPHVPLQFSLALAAGEQVLGHHSANSGGVTRDSNVTVIGHTTPNSIVFTDKLTGPRANDYKFTGSAIAVNSAGYFSYPVALKGALTPTEYLVVTPFGQQTIRAFPIRKV
jgi:hypothetical protein